jgi:pilus assembly protein CpaE
MFDRLLTKCDEHLSLLAAPSLLEKTYDFDEGAFDAMLDIALASVSNLVLDMPHLWTAWSRKTLLAADEIVITAAPDLANLKNARNLVNALRKARPNDPPPKLILNLVGMPKRPEIKPQVFAEALQLEPMIVLPFNAQAFGAAGNNGRMVADVAGRGALAVAFREIAESLNGRPPPQSDRGLFGLNWSLRRKKAASAKA